MTEQDQVILLCLNTPFKFIHDCQVNVTLTVLSFAVVPPDLPSKSHTTTQPMSHGLYFQSLLCLDPFKIFHDCPASVTLIILPIIVVHPEPSSTYVTIVLPSIHIDIILAIISRALVSCFGIGKVRYVGLPCRVPPATLTTACSAPSCAQCATARASELGMYRGLRRRQVCHVHLSDTPYETIWLIRK